MVRQACTSDNVTDMHSTVPKRDTRAEVAGEAKVPDHKLRARSRGPNPGTVTGQGGR
jgi:hypothetical protein